MNKKEYIKKVLTRELNARKMEVHLSKSPEGKKEASEKVSWLMEEINKL